MTAQIIIDVPFIYKLEHVPKHKRNPVPFEIRDSAPARLLAPTPQEAPVALRYKLSMTSWRGDKPVDHLWFGGKLWRPFSESRGDRDDRPMTLEEMKQNISRTHDVSGSPFRSSSTSWRGKDAIPLAQLPAGRIHDDGELERQQMILKIAEDSESLIVVDGKIYREAPEPVYEIGQNGGFFRARDPNEPRYHLTTIDVTEVKPEHGPNRYFRVDQYDDALAKLMDAEGVETISKKKMADYVWYPVEVLIPEAVNFVFDMRPRVDAAVDHLLDNMRKHVADEQLPWIEIYLEFRDKLAEQPRNHQEVIDLLRARVVDILDQERFRYDRDRVAEVIQEWVNRPSPDTVSGEDLGMLDTAVSSAA